MAEIVRTIESKMWSIAMDDTHTPPGSESMACDKSSYVNVGDPNITEWDRVLADKIKNRGS